MTTFYSYLNFGQRVTIDGDDSIIGTIVSFWFKDCDICSVEVSWFHNGEVKSGWFAHSRLTVRGT